MTSEENDRLVLYSYWRSSAAYRVRIALNLKGLDFEQVPVHLVRDGGEQHDDTFRSVNPQGLVPVLLHRSHILSQSMAICEYLEERFPRYALLPRDPADRARTRSLALQVGCEIHPLNNLRVQKYLQQQYGESANAPGWMSHWINQGFGAIEQQLDDHDLALDSHEDIRPGLFECFLVPQVYNAERFATDLSAYPRIRQIVSRCRELPAFIEAAPENQPDAESI